MKSRSINVFGRALPVWLLVIGIVGAGSMAIAVQPVSDEKIHIQNDDGKIHTNVPVAASRTFTPLSVEFDVTFRETDLHATGPGVAGSTIISSQKLVVNFITQVSTETTILIPVNNRSEDGQIFLIKAGAPAHVILDMADGTDVDVHGLVGHNEWLASIDGETQGDFEMRVNTTDAGFYPIVVELLRVG